MSKLLQQGEAAKSASPSKAERCSLLLPAVRYSRPGRGIGAKSGNGAPCRFRILGDLSPAALWRVLAAVPGLTGWYSSPCGLTPATFCKSLHSLGYCKRIEGQGQAPHAPHERRGGSAWGGYLERRAKNAAARRHSRPEPGGHTNGKAKQGEGTPGRDTHTDQDAQKPGGGEEARIIRKRWTEAGCNPPGRKARGIAAAWVPSVFRPGSILVPFWYPFELFLMYQGRSP